MLDAPYRIVLLGEAGVGKTALSIQMVCNNFIENYDYDPTIEDLYRNNVVVDGQPCTLEILDTGGMIYKTNEELRNSWINSGAGFILVYSISSRASFVQALSICQQVRNIKETGTSLLSEFGPTTSLESSSALVPIVLAGSHCEKSTGREVSVQEGYDLAQTLGCHFFEVSTKDRTCVQNAFYDIIRLLQRQRGLVLQKETVAYKKNSTRLKPKKPKSLIGQCLKPFVSWARVRYRKKLLRQAPRRNRHTV